MERVSIWERGVGTREQDPGFVETHSRMLREERRREEQKVPFDRFWRQEARFALRHETCRKGTQMSLPLRRQPPEALERDPVYGLTRAERLKLAFEHVPEDELLYAMMHRREPCPECDPLVPTYRMVDGRWERCECWDRQHGQ